MLRAKQHIVRSIIVSGQRYDCRGKFAHLAMKDINVKKSCTNGCVLIDKQNWWVWLLNNRNLHVNFIIIAQHFKYRTVYIHVIMMVFFASAK